MTINYRKIFKRIIIPIIAIIIIFNLLSALLFLSSPNKNGSRSIDKFYSGHNIYTSMLSDEEKMNTLSDIDGLSMKEKEDLGLQYWDDSDTDLDGLTDKEEIEIYGSDPLKTSSADDLFTDKQKIDAGIDPYEYYEYDGMFEFYNATPDDIYAYPTTAKSYYADIKRLYDENEETKSGYATIVEPIKKPVKYYTVANFDGELVIGFSDLDDSYDNYDIYVYNHQNANDNSGEKIEYEIISSAYAELDYEFVADNNYDVYIVNKNDNNIQYSASGNIISKNAAEFQINEGGSFDLGMYDVTFSDYPKKGSDGVYHLTDEDWESEWFTATGGVITIGNAVLAGKYKIFPKTYYCDWDYSEGGHHFYADMYIDGMVDAWNDYMLTPHMAYTNDPGLTRENSPHNFIKVSPRELMIRYKIYQDLLANFHAIPYTFVSDLKDPTSKKLESVLMWYSQGDVFRYAMEHYDELKDVLEETEPEEDIKDLAHNAAGKGIGWDAPNHEFFKFNNFGTDNNSAGVCAGLSYYMAMLHNEESYSGVGNFGNVHWDITTDPENKCLLQKGGPSSYKDEYWSDDRKTETYIGTQGSLFSKEDIYRKGNIDLSKLTSGEKEFVKMIDSMQTWVNDETKSYSVTNRTFNKQDTWDRFEEVIVPHLDNGEMLLVGVGYIDKNGNDVGHMLVLYGLRYDKSTENQIILYCKDPNKGGNGMIFINRATKFASDGTPIDAYDFQYLTGNYNFNSIDHKEYSIEIYTTELDRIL